ncbi:MAG: heme-binding protein [Gammaproteobacteria bacterium]|nr:heme-binding protein [Gammaproteobacteria bacterium]
MAIEEAKYELVLKEGQFEVRDYAPYLLAEVTVEGEFEEAGNKAFQYLFKYISGANQPQAEIAMTTPVSQQEAGEEIAMTAPVSQRDAGEEISMTAPVSQSGTGKRYEVSFMMPASYTPETLPEPTNDRVLIRQVPEHRMAVIRYSGLWSKANYQKHKLMLDRWITEKGYKVIGEPVWARFNAPFSLWFLRRNEIQIPIAEE